MLRFRTPIYALILCLMSAASLRAADPPAVVGGVKVVENLFGAELLPGGAGWVVGAFGAIFHTADGGLSWSAQETPTVEYLFAVDFVSPTDGVVVGKSGTVLRTEDGGQSWTSIESGTDRNLFSVAHASADEVWAVGDWGCVIHSKDGGRSWQDRTLEDDIVLTSIAWQDEKNGLLAGEFGTVQITRDGGETFVPSRTPTDKTFFGAAYPAPEEMWVVGIDGLVLRSQDGGQTWEVKRGIVGASSLETLGFLEAMKNPGLYDISFSGSYGYVVGDIGMVLVSDDRGETWVERKLPAEMSLFWVRSVAASEGERALVAGANGLTATFDQDRVKLKKPTS